MAEFSLGPAELDRIEDALESLEGADQIEDDSPAVRERLADYRELLRASREALPMEEVPAGALDAVLAEARAGAAATTPAEAAVVAPGAQQNPQHPQHRQPESWWTRFRRTLLLPGLAVAGTAALVLVIVRPTLDSAERAEPHADRGPVASAKVEQTRPTTLTVELPDADAQPEFEGAAAEQSEDKGEYKTEDGVVEIATSRRLGAQQKTADATDAPAAAPEPSAGEKQELDVAQSDLADEDAGSSAPRWDIIARGDRARKKNDCTTARTQYAMALKDDGDDRVMARAHAGMGLCAAWDGRSKAAAESYSRARQLDPAIDAWIENERPRGGGAAPRASRAKKRKAKPSATAGRKSSRAKSKKSAPLPKQSDEAKLDPLE